MTHVAFRQSAETNTNPDLLLLEFSEQGGDVFQRAVDNSEDVIFEGNTFVATDIGAFIPSEGDTFKAPSLTFSNVSRAVGRAVLASETRIVCRLIHIDGADYTVSGGVRTYYTAIQDTKNMVVVEDAEVDILSASGTLGAALSADLPYPFNRTHKQVFPGVYI